MRPSDTNIRNRTIEELRKVGGYSHEIAKRTGCPSNLVQYWLDGEYTPSAVYLAKLHDAGCDVLYILTGKRYTISGGDTDV
jgi:transcriptional regulator with XRE-family HTH domain